MAVKRVGRVIGGWVLLAVGAALLVLPGPGLLVIAAGLALLATEYEWAARLLRKARQRLAAIRKPKTALPKTALPKTARRGTALPKTSILRTVTANQEGSTR